MTKQTVTIALEYVLDINSTIRSLAKKYHVSKTMLHKWIRDVAEKDSKLGKLIDKKAAGNHKLANARHIEDKVEKVSKSIMSDATRIRLKGKIDKLKRIRLTPGSWKDFLWK